MNWLAQKHITLGIAGGISAYRTIDLIRLIKKYDAAIQVIPTRNALQFVTEMTLETLSGNRCLTHEVAVENGKISHIEEAYRTDLILIAPATADLIAKMAQGFADEILLQTLLSFRGPVIIVPAMETNMWEHPATQSNVAILKSRGVSIIGPDFGDLASGRSGLGRMASPERIFESILACFAPQDFRNVRALVSAGPTLEDIDPVRFLSNYSSGKMGVALARALVHRGAVVDLVHGPLQIEIPKLPRLRLHPIKNAQTMHDQVLSLSPQIDLAILCAAVADYRPETTMQQKIKKSNRLDLTLVKNPDILAALGKQEHRPFLVGFAAETMNLEQNARQKCIEKNCDLICANWVNDPSIGFGADNNEITIVDKSGTIASIAKSSKHHIANQILDAVSDQRDHKNWAAPEQSI